ncbi:hypothetical protein [Thalassovita mangrovi]|uniref:Peptidase S74 domain-containing protein n=1 Tax=Thalassovita mangrovi TaxID=2692236 RepID=A0A6L8LIV2_9RHOB|nr:hypothetical protein [Thalassovita mangrovi]MYM55961.1 hypothetical protein [Thalassovita mangrovi]
MKDLKRNALKFLASSALVAVTGAASADEVFIQDVIVQGSLCVGVDCVNGEAFGFDTIRLKENNVRIKFDDTSASSAFPNTDWELQANESSNGGHNWFALLDGTNSKRPFTVEANARNNAMYISSAGRLGLGTSAPGVDIDVLNGNTPALRLQQDSSSGFTAQTWDVAGNETNFFVRDVTNASRIPFKIRPTAPTNSLYIDTDGDIGLGTASPDAPLDVEENSDLTAGTPHLLVNNTNATARVRRMIGISNFGGAFIHLENRQSGVAWTMTNANTGTSFLINDPSTTDPELELAQNGDLTIRGNLVTGGGGTCDPGPCDAVFDPDVYEVPSIKEHAEFMWANKRLPALDPTLPGQPINVTLKLTRMLNELEHAHIYIEQLNDRIAELETRIQ